MFKIIVDKNIDISDEYIQNIKKLFEEAFYIFTNKLKLKNPFQNGIYFDKGAKYIKITIKDIPIQRGLVAANVTNDAINITLHKSLKINTATPIHELFHVFQYNYCDINNMWFMEGLARWSQNLIQTKAMKDEKLPQNKDELEILLYKLHEAEYFWRKLFTFIDNENNFVKELLEDLAKYTNIENKKDLKNNYLILNSLVSIFKKIDYKRDKEIINFLSLLENTLTENSENLNKNYDVATDTYIGDIIIDDTTDMKEYKHIKYIQGSLEINKTSLVSIDTFNSLKQVSNFIKIINNKKLTSVSFLQSLQNVGSSLYLHNNSLENLVGLEKLQSVGASFSLSNNKLSNLKELKNLKSINGILNLYNNNLTSLEGIENLETLKTKKWNNKNQTINIASNKNLKDISALQNVQTFDNYIIVHYDKSQIFEIKPHFKSNFCKNILEFIDAKTFEYTPTFKLFSKKEHNYKNFRKTTHNNLLTHIFDFELEDADTLVISFVGFNGFLGGVFYNKFPLITEGINTHKIFIHDKNNSWYHSGIPNFTKDIEETIELLKKLSSFKKYKRIICFGASMGAYMSLLVGKILVVDKIVAFAPQTFLDKENRKKYKDTRWGTNLDKLNQNIPKKYLDLNELYKNGCDNIDIEIHYAKNSALDMQHIEHLKASCIKKIGYDIDSHYVSIYLRDTKQINTIIKRTLNLKITKVGIISIKVLDTLQKEANKFFDKVIVIQPNELIFKFDKEEGYLITYKNESLNDLSAFFMYNHYMADEKIILFFLKFLKLNNCPITICKPKALGKLDKLLNDSLINYELNSYVIANKKSINKVQDFSFPIVAKPILGSGGINIEKLHTFNELNQHVNDYFIKNKNPLIIEQYIHIINEWRVYVINGECICSYEKIKPHDNFKYNLAQGGGIKKTKLKDEKRIFNYIYTRLTKNHIDGFLGIDIIKDKHNVLRILEVNMQPGWKNVEKVTSINIINKLFESLFSRYMNTRY